MKFKLFAVFVLFLLLLATFAHASIWTSEVAIVPDTSELSDGEIPVYEPIRVPEPVDEFKLYIQVLNDTIVRSGRVEGCDCYDIKRFNTTSVDGLKKFLEYSKIDENEYYINGYNCINFSDDLINELRMFNFNATFVELHNEKSDISHLIVGVALNDNMVFIEPQADKIFTLDDLSKCDSYDYTLIVYYNFLTRSGWC